MVSWRLRALLAAARRLLSNRSIINGNARTGTLDGSTFGLAFLVLVGASPPSHEYDPLFWFMCGNVVALAVLRVLLHDEKNEDTRVGFIR